MPKPQYLAREEKRKANRVRQDIERTDKILREDVYDLLREYETRTAAAIGLRKFLEALTSPAIEYLGNKQDGIERVISDIDSYDIEWEE